jgi:hypothetical protein
MARVETVRSKGSNGGFHSEYQDGKSKNEHSCENVG